MWSNLIVLHSESKERDQFEFSGYYHWKTCMRTVYIGDSRMVDAEKSAHNTPYEIYEGYDAYRLILEIASGLRSKLLGETEVLAQFKERLQAANLPPSPFGEYLAKFRDLIIEDSRKIRSGYLRNLGDQSYGGLAHRYLKDIKKVILFGTGQLAEKVLPWVLESAREVKVAGRNSEKLGEIAKNYLIAGTDLLEQVEFNCEAVVIASSIPFGHYVSKLQNVSIVVDFREDNYGEKYPKHLRYISFEEMLNSLKENEERNEKLKQKLVPIVSEIVEEREMQSHQFVFGWDDIPCYAA